MRRRRSARCALALGAAWLGASAAHAAPEWHTGVSLGVAGTGASSLWSDTRFYGAVGGDVLFGRARATDVGFGPALAASTVGFSDARLMTGGTVLLPLGDLLALGVTPGGTVRFASGDVLGGVTGRAFFGARAHNFTGSYALAGGLVLGFDQDLGGKKEHALTAALELDGAVLALPFVMLIEWIRGPRD
jgi:hypothetical protein